MSSSSTDKPTRFQADLEFVQCLANPHYCHFLASSGMLDDKRFLAYLSYLRYWHRPEYSPYISYPSCLKTLDALCTSVEVRQAFKSQAFVGEVDRRELEAYLSWSHGMSQAASANMDSSGAR